MDITNSFNTRTCRAIIPKTKKSSPKLHPVDKSIFFLFSFLGTPRGLLQGLQEGRGEGESGQRQAESPRQVCSGVQEHYVVFRKEMKRKKQRKKRVNS